MDPTVLAPALLSKIIPKEERAQALELAKLDLISGFADVVLGHISLSFSFSTLRKLPPEPLYFSVVMRTRNKFQSAIVLHVRGTECMVVRIA